MENFPQASQAELEILKIIWQSDNKIEFRPLCDKLNALYEERNTSTIMTFLRRLTQKGLITVEKGEQNNLYVATFTEAEFRERQTQSFITDVYGGNTKELIASLVKSERLTQKDIEELTEFWQQGGSLDE